MSKTSPVVNDSAAQALIAETLQLALACHQAQRHGDAEALLRSILEVQPQHAQANHSLGTVLLHVGDAAAALEYLSAACAIAPETGLLWISAADCLLRLHRPEECMQVLETALQAGLEDERAVALLAQARAELPTTATTEPAIASPTGSWQRQSDNASLLAELENLRARSVRRAALRRKLQPDASPALLPFLETNDWPGLEVAARQSLQRMPERGKDWALLGMAHLQLNQNEAALIALSQACRLLPADAVAWDHLGIAQRQAGQHKAADQSFKRSLKLQPLRPETWVNLGNLQLDLSRADLALDSFQRALILKPDFAAAWDHLGIAQRQSGQQRTAEISFIRSLELQPLRPETWVNLGNLQLDLSRPDAAINSFQRALVLRPDFVPAHTNLGNAYRDLGQLEEAVTSYRQALELKPTLAEAHSNLGNSLRDLGLADEAIACYRRALELMPSLAEAHSGLGRVLIDHGQLDAAIASYRQSLEIRPDLTDVRSNLLQTLNAQSLIQPARSLDEARVFGRTVTRGANPPFSSWMKGEPGKPLRVGLVSGDLRNHPVGYFLESLLGQIDAASIELVAYPTNPLQDQLTARLRPSFSNWVPLRGMTNEAAARQIHADGIQVLLDLSGHTAHNRLPLFAWKPAPVQASWLGYFATTGLAEMDFLIGDPHVTPPEEALHFSEALWRLPETYLCFTPPDVALDIVPLPALAAGHITFGCFNNLTKMNDAVVSLWAKVLQAVPGSRLLLKTKQLGLTAQVEATCQRFAAQGIAPARLMLEGASPRTELLATYNRVDVALDPFPYPGGTTSVEGLWMGVPVITRKGDRFLSHVGETITHNVGLADWIAADDDDYVAKAVAHTADLDRLARLRAGLRRQVQASPLFDARRFARHFEAAMWGMWQARSAQLEGKLQ